MSAAASPLARRLYLRIWLAVVGSVAVLSLLTALAWHVAEQASEAERERERQQTSPGRELTVRNAAGQPLSDVQAQWHRNPGEPPQIALTLADGQALTLHMAPRPGGRGAGPRRGEAPVWLRPPYGFLWMLGLAGLMVMLGVYPVARRLTQRLEGLQQRVQRWGEGDLSVRVPVQGHDEVADLARRFNDAAARVEALMTAQKSLLANASHELRSPLARIRMALELALGGGSPAARAEILRNIGELDQLIDEILLASRLDAREADLGTVEPVDLVGLLAEECAATGAELQLLTDRVDALEVPGVAKLLRRLVRNLLENARRHGRGHTVASLDADAEQVTLVVADDGPGVPPALRERIFEPFFRVPGASESAGGVGLGLALVRSIAERHGGQVRCGPGPGGGAAFTVHLPRVATAADSGRT